MLSSIEQYVHPPYRPIDHTPFAWSARDRRRCSAIEARVMCTFK
jgi:hypothetical protein